MTTPQAAVVRLTSSQVSLVVGESQQLNATVQDNKGNTLGGQTIRWSSEQPNIAAVTPDGTVQGIGVGTTIVTATSGSASAAAAVTVGPAVGFGVDRTVVDFTTPLNGQAGPETVLVSASSAGSTDGLSLTTQYLGSATGWLDVALSSNSTPSSVVLSADAQGLAAGDYSATVTIAAAGAASQTIQVNLTVSNAPAIGLGRNSARFEVQQNGAVPASQTVQVTNLGGGSLSSLSTSVLYTTGQASGWLTASLQGSVAPTTLSLSVNQASLGPGTYDAVVRVASGVAANSPVDLPVTLVVSAATPEPRISLTDSVVTFVGTQGQANPSPFVVSIANSGGGTLNGLQATPSYSAGQPTGWLQTSLSTLTAPSDLTLSPQIGTLQAGTYQASVNVSGLRASNSPRSITVLLTVDPPPTMAAAPASASFSASVGGSDPTDQTIALSNSGGGSIQGLSTAITYASGSGWLSANLSSTTAPSTLTLSATLGSLAQGTYNATVRVSSGDAANSPLSIPVSFDVGPSASGIRLAPTALTFTAVRGGPNVASQSVAVTNSGGLPLTGLSASATGYSSGASGWATTSLSGTTAPATLTVSPQTTALSPGTHTASVRVASPGATNSPQSVAVQVDVPGVAVSPSNVNVTASASGSTSSQVTLSNAGSGTLSGYTSSIAYTGGATGWLTSTFSGNTMTLVASGAGLGAGNTYQATVTVKAAEDVVGAPVTVSMTVTSPPAIGLSPVMLALADTAAPGPVTGSIAVNNVGAGTLSGLSTAVSYTAGGSGWLSATLSGTTAPATVALTATPTALPPGTYTASVTVSSSSTGVNNNPSVALVTLTVAPRPTIAVSPGSATFSASQGGPNPAAQTLNVTNGGTGSLTGLGATVSYGAGATGWLTATPSGTTAPSTISLSATTGSLAAGTYTATVNVTSSAGRVTNSPQAIPVTFTVGAPPAIAVTPGSLALSGLAGATTPVGSTGSITNGGGGSLTGLSVDSIIYAQGAGWLAATVSPGSAPATLTVSATSAALTAGAYSATVFVGSSAAGVANNPAAVPVTFTVGAGPTITLNPNALTFSGTAGVAGTPSQVVNVSNTGGGVLSSLSVDSIVYANGTGWLTTALAATSAPTTATVTPDATSLTAGSYNATVYIGSTAAGVTNSPQSFSVTFDVAAATSIGISTTSVTHVLSEPPGVPATGSTVVDITDSGAPLAGLSASINYGTGTGWLTAVLSGTTTPATLTLQSTLGALTPGTYDATVTIASTTPGTTAKTVAVTLIVQAAPAISLGGVEGTTLVFGAAGPASTPVNVTNSGGGPPTALAALATTVTHLPVAGACTAAGTGWLAATLDQNTSPAVVTVQPTAGALTTGTYCAAVDVASSTGQNSPQSFLVEFTIP